MPKPMRKRVKLKFSTPTRTNTDVAIEERIAGCGRKEAEHIIYVGQLVERMLKSEFGAVLKALTAGRTSAELGGNKDGHISADRILGRIEMADSLWGDLEQFVLDKDAQLRPIETHEASKQMFSTSEPYDSQRAEETVIFSP